MITFYFYFRRLTFLHFSFLIRSHFHFFSHTHSNLYRTNIAVKSESERERAKRKTHRWKYRNFLSENSVLEWLLNAKYPSHSRKVCVWVSERKRKKGKRRKKLIKGEKSLSIFKCSSGKKIIFCVLERNENFISRNWLIARVKIN
jgi:hypothetical protein